MTPILQAGNLTKTFGSATVVDDLSFSINPGDIYGFLGQNGAGKSTTMRMLLGLIFPTSGTIEIKGQSFTKSRRGLLSHIGAVIERPDLYGYLTGLENLRLFARLSDMKISNERLNHLLELVQLKGRGGDAVKKYSQGMKQRLGIAIALVHSPELLILDEPTNGLDPQGIAEMRELIIHLSHEHGKTIIISSHLLYEIEQMANRMLIIHQGKKIAEGEVATLLHPDETLMEVKLLPDERIPSLIAGSRWKEHIVEQGIDNIIVKMNPNDTPLLTRWLIDAGLQVMEIRSRHSLEAYFLNLTHAVTTPHRAV